MGVKVATVSGVVPPNPLVILQARTGLALPAVSLVKAGMPAAVPAGVSVCNLI